MATNYIQDGNRVTILASSVVGPNSPIKSGDPCVIGRLTGVAQADATPGAVGPYNDSNVVIETRGVFQLTVISTHHAITIGSTVYIDPSTGVVSDDLTDVPFGVVLAQVNQYATTKVAVKLFGATPGAVGADS